MEILKALGILIGGFVAGLILEAALGRNNIAIVLLIVAVIMVGVRATME